MSLWDVRLKLTFEHSPSGVQWLHVQAGISLYTNYSGVQSDVVMEAWAFEINRDFQNRQTIEDVAKFILSYVDSWARRWTPSYRVGHMNFRADSCAAQPTLASVTGGTSNANFGPGFFGAEHIPERYSR